LLVIIILIGISEARNLQNLNGLHVKGNKIVNSDGQYVHLRGVDRSGTEYACIQGWGIFDGPIDLASVQAMATWDINIVRIPLNEDCWLGINGVKSQYGGVNYQNAIFEYVQLLNSQGMAAILDLHWTAPSTKQATSQQPMPDQDHSPAFWQSVGTMFQNNTSIIFDLFNEPYPDNNNWNSTAGWTCWLNGGSCSGVNFPAVGMQTLVDTVRSTGAQNIVMLGGLAYSNSLAEWLQYKPNDSTGNMAASWHSYNFNHCNSQSCWEDVVAPVANTIPVIAGEFGENDCATGYISQLLPWMDTVGIHYLAWTWNTWDCASGPSVISDYSGTPTAYGKGVYQHYTNTSQLDYKIVSFL